MQTGTSQRSPPRKVLIIEDNELNLKLLNDILEVHGYATIFAASGAAGLDLAHQHHPDLILLDIQLPDISGTEVAQRLKADAQTHPIPVVAVTAFAMPGDRAMILESGCDDYVAKPINVRDFLTLVERYIDPAMPGSPDR
jgi:two-component system, cell cycle response regulator DivK